MHNKTLVNFDFKRGNVHNKWCALFAAGWFKNTAHFFLANLTSARTERERLSWLDDAGEDSGVMNSSPDESCCFDDSGLDRKFVNLLRALAVLAFVAFPTALARLAVLLLPARGAA